MFAEDRDRMDGVLDAMDEEDVLVLAKVYRGNRATISGYSCVLFSIGKLTKKVSTEGEEKSEDEREEIEDAEERSDEDDDEEEEDADEDEEDEVAVIVSVSSEGKCISRSALIFCIWRGQTRRPNIAELGSGMSLAKTIFARSAEEQ